MTTILASRSENLSFILVFVVFLFNEFYIENGLENIKDHIIIKLLLK